METGRTTTRMHDLRHHELAAEDAQSSHVPVVPTEGSADDLGLPWPESGHTAARKTG